jgi:hypothetical protein
LKRKEDYQRVAPLIGRKYVDEIHPSRYSYASNIGTEREFFIEYSVVWNAKACKPESEPKKSENLIFREHIADAFWPNVESHRKRSGSQKRIANLLLDNQVPRFDSDILEILTTGQVKLLWFLPSTTGVFKCAIIFPWTREEGEKKYLSRWNGWWQVREQVREELIKSLRKETQVQMSECASEPMVLNARIRVIKP